MEDREAVDTLVEVEGRFFFSISGSAVSLTLLITHQGEAVDPAGEAAAVSWLRTLPRSREFPTFFRLQHPLYRYLSWCLVVSRLRIHRPQERGRGNEGSKSVLRIG